MHNLYSSTYWGFTSVIKRIFLWTKNIHLGITDIIIQILVEQYNNSMLHNSINLSDWNIDLIL